MSRSRFAWLALALAAPVLAGPGTSWLGGERPAPPPSPSPEVPIPPKEAPTEPAPPSLEALAPGPDVPTGASVWSLAFDLRGNLVAAQSDGRAAVYRLPASDPTGSHWPSSGRVLAVATTGRGAWTEGYGVAAGGDAGFVSVGGRGGFPAYYFRPEGPVWGMAFRPDARRIAVVGDFEGVREYATDTPMGSRREGARDEFRVLASSGPSHSDVRYSPDGSRLYASSSYQDRDPRVRILDASPAGAGEVAALRGHTQPIRGLDLSRDGAWLATGSYDRSLRLWDVEARTQRWLVEFDEDVNGVAIDSRGRWVAAGIDDGTLAVVALATGRTLVRFPAHRGHISAVAFSPRGDRLYTGGLEPLIRSYPTAPLEGLR